MIGSKGEELLKVTTNSVEKLLSLTFYGRPPEGYIFDNEEQAYEYAVKYVKKNKVRKIYFVMNLYPFSLSDISPGVGVKTPAKYFNTYLEARIHQLLLAEENDRNCYDDIAFYGPNRLMSEGDVGELREFREHRAKNQENFKS